MSVLSGDHVKKIAYLAVREFVATAGTRAFILGLLAAPAIITFTFTVGMRYVFPMFASRNTPMKGQVAIVDPTRAVIPELRETFDGQRISRRRAELARQALAAVPDEVRQFADGSGPVAASSQAIEAALGGIPELRLVERPGGADVQQEKRWLAVDAATDERHLALVVIHPNAVVPAGEGSTYGAYDLYVAANLEGRVENQIHQSVREAIVNARARAQALDPARIDAMVRVARARSVTVTQGEDRRNVQAFNRAVPFVFVGLLLFAVMMGGQTLLTSTIEEKSNRVIEVLLSAVSPLQLMAGKILGQMAVSFVALSLYVGTGLVVLLSFALFGLLDLALLFYLLVFFVIGYLVTGSLMMAVGAAVNDMREAQSMMMPFMLMLVVPWVLAPIVRDPNSTLSIVASFVPPINTFAMLLRLASSVPPPWWQVWLSILVGVASVVAAVWFAAKVFRIGLLLYGKPPNVATLIRWVRAA